MRFNSSRDLLKTEGCVGPSCGGNCALSGPPNSNGIRPINAVHAEYSIIPETAFPALALPSAGSQQSYQGKSDPSVDSPHSSKHQAT